jgi:hypothetical protein
MAGLDDAPTIDHTARGRPEGFDYPAVSKAQMLKYWGVIDGIEAAKHNLRMSLRMLEVTHKLFPYPTQGYRKVRRVLNSAVRELQAQYPKHACYTCVLDGQDPETCAECEGRGYLT